MRVLDVASGTGFVALSAARALGPEGVVVANDISEPMLMQVTEKAKEAGISIDCHLHDIETADFDQESFHRILCSNGMAYLQQPHDTLQKFRGWLVTGGKLCFNNPLAPMVPLTDIIRRLAADLFGLEIADAASIFGTSEAIISSCEAAGFKDIQVTATQELRLFNNTTPEVYASNTFDSMASFPFTPLDGVLDSEQLQQLKAAYMPHAIAMGQGMQREDGNIALHYTMLWAIAVA